MYVFIKTRSRLGQFELSDSHVFEQNIIIINQETRLISRAFCSLQQNSAVYKLNSCLVSPVVCRIGVLIILLLAYFLNYNSLILLHNARTQRKARVSPPYVVRPSVRL